jgi:hypothetical protein
MRQALGVLLHLAHVALLLIAVLDDSRVRRSTRPDLDRLARESSIAHYDPTRDQMEPDVASAPRCPMPVWQPNPNVTYAAMVIGVDRVAAGVAGPAPCINPYARTAAHL